MANIQVPVLQPIPAIPLPPVLNLNEYPAFSAKLDVPLVGLKKIILIVSKDISPEDMRLFQSFKVIEYDHDIHANLPISSYDWEILILDIREKGDRYCYLKEVQTNRDAYKVVVFCNAFEEDLIDDADNVISKFPERQARKEDFSMLLFTKRLKKPRWWVSLGQCLLSVVKASKN